MSKQQQQRQHLLMKLLVEKYIHEGLPVGSKFLQQSSGLKLSSATIRHVLSDLEKLGLLSSPHTSAGRIPTNEGMRFFVDKLISCRQEEPLTHQIENFIANEAKEVHSDKNQLLLSTNQFISHLTNMASVVMLPHQKTTHLQHIEFVPLSDEKILAVLVTSEGEIQNKIIAINTNYQVQHLHHMANFLNQSFAGQSLVNLQQKLIDQMQDTHSHMEVWMKQAIELAKQSLDQINGNQQSQLLCSGETNLMQYKDMHDMKMMQDLFNTFHEQQKMLDILAQLRTSQGVQIFIGSEAGVDALSPCSLVAKPYQLDDETVGVLGVIGPTRMSYNKIIPIVDITANLLTSTLNQKK